MRGALLFLTAIMVVTPGGRAQIEDFVGRTATFYAAGDPYTAIMLWLTAGMALVLFLMVRHRKPAQRQVIVIRSEASGQVHNDTPEPPRKKVRFAWLRRLTLFSKRPSCVSVRG